MGHPEAEAVGPSELEGDSVLPRPAPPTAPVANSSKGSDAARMAQDLAAGSSWADTYAPSSSGAATRDVEAGPTTVATAMTDGQHEQPPPSYEKATITDHGRGPSTTADPPAQPTVTPQVSSPPAAEASSYVPEPTRQFKPEPSRALPDVERGDRRHPFPGSQLKRDQDEQLARRQHKPAGRRIRLCCCHITLSSLMVAGIMLSLSMVTAP